MQYTRDQIKEALLALLLPLENVLAAWEGGSTATGFLDEYSDLDLIIVIKKNDDTDDVFGRLEQHFKSTYGILQQFRVPEPAWHGMSQCFYFLDQTGEYFYADIAVVNVDKPAKFSEADRHGNAEVWFDKANVYSPTNTPMEETKQLVEKVFKSVTAIDFIMIRELKKALARDNWIASQMNYIQFIYRNLVPLMNIKYRPAKADFGIRYAEREYPPEEAHFLEELLRINSVDEISQKFSKALQLYEELKNSLLVEYS